MLNRLEAIFIAENLRHELPLEAASGKYAHFPTTLALFGHKNLMSDEVIDVFWEFLQETSCHLVSLSLGFSGDQQLRRMLRALHCNKSVTKLEMHSLSHNDDIGFVEEFFRRKTDLTNLTFCRWHFRISDTLYGLLGSLTQLTKIKFDACGVEDEGLRLLLQHKYSFINELSLHGNRISSHGLGMLARHCRDAFPSLEILDVSANRRLLNNRENTRCFIKNVLPMLKELNVADCHSQCCGYVQIMHACGMEAIDKLALLNL
jgi:hypothetical protein